MSTKIPYAWAMLRNAVAMGVKTDKIVSTAKFMSRTGLNVEFVSADAFNRSDVNALYSRSANKIYINAEANSKTFDELIVHETSHALYTNAKIRKIINKMAKNLTSEERREIRKTYSESLKGKTLSQRAEIMSDEFGAHYLEYMLNREGMLNALLSEDGSISQNLASVINKTSEAYKNDKHLAPATKRVFKAYKKALQQFSEANKGMNAYSELIVDKEGDGRASFAGTKAKTANLSHLATARDMLKNGATSEEVRKATGWFKGYDGKWRFEIDDFDSSLIDNPKLTKHVDDGEVYFTGKLSDIFDHKELFAAYPELKGINIVIQKTDFGIDAIYQPRSNYITLSIEQFKRHTKEYGEFLNGGRKAEIERIEATPEYREYNKFYDDEVMESMDPQEWLEAELEARNKFYSSELGKRYYRLMWGKENFTGEKFEFGWDKSAKEVVLHELQHAIQNIEGFAKGTNTRDKNYDLNAGEIEARDVAKRANLTAEQRKNTRPDVDRTDAVVIGNSSIQNALIGWTSNDIEVYETSDSTKSMSISDRIKAFRKGFLQQFKGRTAKFERNGHTYYARFVESSSGLGKFVHEGNNPRSKSDDSGYKAKIRLLADGDIFSLVEDSKYQNSKPEIGKTTIAHQNTLYWDYFWKEIFVDGLGYDVVIDIKNDSASNTYNAKEQFVYSIHLVRNKKTAPPVTKPYSSNMGRVKVGSTVDNSILHLSEKINPSDKISSKISVEDGRASLSRPSAPLADAETPSFVDPAAKSVTLQSSEYKSTFKERKSDAWTAIKMDFTNAQAGVERLMRDVGISQPDAEAMVQYTRLASAQANNLIGGNFVDISGNANTLVKKGKGLVGTLAPVMPKQFTKEGNTEAEKRYADFQLYGFHKHNIDRMSREENAKKKYLPQELVLQDLKNKRDTIATAKENIRKKNSQYNALDALLKEEQAKKNPDESKIKEYKGKMDALTRNAEAKQA